MSETPLIFNRALHRHRQNRAGAGRSDHDFLFREVAGRLADRLLDVNRTFPLALDLGCGGGELAAALRADGRIGALIRADGAEALVGGAEDNATGVVLDEEALPFQEGAFDLVISSMALHWVNDLPGSLVQVCRCLKPDGLFLAAMAGVGTLGELHLALGRAEDEIEGGVSPHVSPFADVRDLGNLLMRAGFALPVADTETITVSYPDMFKLMADLRGMGEANALHGRHNRGLRRDTIQRAAEIYRDTFADDAGRIPATFEIVFLTGWAPHASQQRPLAPGSGQTSLADILKDEKPG